MPFLEASAATGDNVDEIFTALAENIKSNIENDPKYDPDNLQPFKLVQSIHEMPRSNDYC
jgi:hypothetical protein